MILRLPGQLISPVNASIGRNPPQLSQISLGVFCTSLQSMESMARVGIRDMRIDIISYVTKQGWDNIDKKLMAHNMQENEKFWEFNCLLKRNTPRESNGAF